MYGQDVFDPEVCVLAAAENQSMKNGGHCKLLVGRQRIQNREFWCSRISPGILNILDLNEKYSRRYFVSSVRSSSGYHGLIEIRNPLFQIFSNSSDSKVKVKVKGPNMCYIFEKHGIQGYRI